MGLPRRSLLLASILVALWSWMLYSNNWDASFQYDDYPNILDNEAIRVDRLSWGGLLAAATRSPIPTRPLANISFAVNYRFSSFSVRPYHWVNNGIHALTAVGLLLAVALLLSSAPLASRYATVAVPAGIFSAVLWASHPAHVQAVTYVVQRMASLAAMFVIWSLVAALVGMRRAGAGRAVWFSAAAGLWLLGLASKETAAILPAVIVGGGMLLFGARRGFVRVGLVASGVAAAGLGAIGLIWGPTRLLGALLSLFSQPLQLLTLPRALFYGLSLLAFPLPTRFGLIHPLEHSASLLQPATTLPAIVALLAVLAAPFLLRQRQPLLALGMLWVVILFLAETAMVKHNPFFEHRLYLSSIGLFAAAGLALAYVWSRRPRSTGVLVGVVVLGLSWATHARNQVWSTEVTLWQDAVRNAPDRTVAYPNLIRALLRESRHAEASRYYEKLAAIPPRFHYDHHSIGRSAYMLQRYEAAAEHLQAALALNRSNCWARDDLIETFASQGRIAAAMQQVAAFEKTCLESNATRRKSSTLRDIKEVVATAQQSMRARLAENPEDLEAHMILSGLLIHQGRCEQAREHLQSILSLAPDNAAAWSNLGFCAYDRGDYVTAAAHQRRALALSPALATAHYGLAQAVMQLGQLAEAAQRFRSYLELAPADDPFRGAAQSHLRRIEKQAGR